MGSAGRRLICSMKNTRNTGLTAYQAITEELHAELGKKVVHSRKFDLMQINDAVRLVHEGHTNGKVIVRFP